ncbi:MAG: DUF2442 domain-containing protein [Chloroflexi bacterium]|nr:DUF2442 domain-containing protein [Chloroflexota bacterium]MBP8002276.1 DUF2442 domain-containing protein [Chloroflexota bacterium]MBP8057011.1 DUF2442 domain-containing protein [Chloroflexota bacterium]MBP8057015.1 DUF2442 domain-containing protein [Chloroflexota bacterium]
MDSLPDIRIVSAFFTNNLLTVALNDGRIIIFPCAEMKWLVQASPEQQQNFSIESDGYGVWWHGLDDGIALHHLLSPTFLPLVEAVI